MVKSPTHPRIQNNAAHPRLPAALTAEMSRLYELGYSLVALGGADGKTPIMSYKDRKRFPLSTVVDRMVGAGSQTYGVRLDGLLVVDVDTDTTEASVFVEQHFGPSSARTKTSRGYHLWYRFRGKKPQDIRLPGIAIDFKTGGNQLVVGPQSERPDGVIYWPIGRLPNHRELPWFSPVRDIDGPAPVAGGGKRVPVGSRNEVLKRRAAYLARHAQDHHELVADLIAVRNLEFEDPASFPDTNVTGLADWAWDLRLKGKLWGGRDSAVILTRSTVYDLISNRHHLALALWAFLIGQHSASPGTVFAVDPRKLREKGHFRDGVNQLYAAIKTLIDHNCLVLHRPARGKRLYHEYRLGSGLKEGRERERAYSSIVLQKGDPKNDKAA